MDKRYGIRVQLPTSDTLTAPHLLGADWSQWHWYPSAEARDRAFEAMLRQPGYYRAGDRPSQVLTKVDP